jgi:hypothetical protein
MTVYGLHFLVGWRRNFASLFTVALAQVKAKNPDLRLSSTKPHYRSVVLHLEANQACLCLRINENKAAQPRGFVFAVRFRKASRGKAE